MDDGFKTKKDLTREILACAKDPIYFFTRYLKIQHPILGLIPFSTFNYQNDLLNAFQRHRFTIVLKARQVGITTLIGCYIFWYIYFYQDKNVLVVATKQEVAKNIIRIIRVASKNLPSWLNLSKILIDNRQSIELNNGSRVKATTTASDVGRGEAVSLLVVDETAFVKNADQLWVGLAPVISTGGRAILASSPNGTGNLFHKLYQQAQNGENNFNCRFGTYVNPNKPEEIINDSLPWWVHPDHDLTWFENETRGKSRREIAQEFECFDGDTRIATKHGFRKIKNIQIGDYVLTHKGRFRKVIFVNSKKASTVYSIKTFLNRKKTLVTGEHPLLHETLGWRASKDFNLGDKVCSFPKMSEFNLKTQKVDLCNFVVKKSFNVLYDENYIFINDRKFKQKINRFIDVDYDLGFLIGIYLAEGYRNKNFISLSFNYETELSTWIVQICDILKKKFYVFAPKIYKSNKSKAGNFQINSQIISDFIARMTVGASCYNKCLSAEAYSVANKEFLKGVLDGVFIGDGCQKFEYCKTLNVTSENLIYDIKYILSILGFNSFGIRNVNNKKTAVILGRNVELAPQYNLKLYKTNNIVVDKISTLLENYSPHAYSQNYKNAYGENENFALSKFVQNDKIEKECIIYNIQVEEDKSFVTEHFVVHNCSFVSSGDTFIFSDDIARLEKQVKEPIERTNFDRNLWIWKYPQRGATYEISCDISRGDSRDFSGFHIIRIDDVKLEVVGEYKGKITPDILGDVLVEASKKYNNAIIAVENNGGWAGQTILKIRQANYPFIYYASRNKREFIDPYYAQFADQRTLNDVAVPGYSVTPLNRIPMLAKMEQYIRMEQIQLYSSRLLDEFRTFSWNNSRPEAQKGYHDDLILSLAGGIWVREESFMNISRNGNNLNQMLLNGLSIEQTTTKQIPQFNFNQSGIYDRGRMQEFVREQNKIIMGDGREEDLSWLIRKEPPIYKG